MQIRCRHEFYKIHHFSILWIINDRKRGVFFMCGIVGFMLKEDFILENNNYKIGRDDKQILEDMMDKIRHRGPDGSGMYLDEHIALGHRRLAIIDVEGGAQPMKNEDGRLVCVFNGEIYNFKELRGQLQELGHRFVTESDTEVLLHGYEEWGKDLPKKLRGMFSFAIWDKDKAELFCARDYFGIKPFYYYHKGSTFLFGSEIKSFLPHPQFEKSFNQRQLELYLTYQYSPGRETFFENVYKLPPAHYLLWKNDILEIQSYWQADFIPNFSKEKRDWETEISKVMKESVAAHKISDVEVGSFLSSGVDSSYIAKRSGVKKTFTIGFMEQIAKNSEKHVEKTRYQIKKGRFRSQKAQFNDTDRVNEKRKYDESAYASAFSQSIGADHILYRISTEEFWKELPTVQYYMDEPLADASAVALYFLNREASSHVKVCLSGEGADELFAGYNIYKEPFMCEKYDRIPLCIRWGIGKLAGLFPCKRGFNFLVRHSQPITKRYIGNTTIFTEKEKKKMLKHFLGKPQPMESVEEPVERKLEKISILSDSRMDFGYLSKIKNFNKMILRREHSKKQIYDDIIYMQMVDIYMWLAGDILLKADKMSMANSLELRVPFLDKDVFQVARQIPTKYKVNAKQTKIIFRAAAAKTIGETNAKREKCGFPVPVREWLKEEPYTSYVRDAFCSPIAEEFFHTKYLLRLLDRHISGKQDNWRQIWCVYMFLVWYEVYFSDKSISAEIN